MYNTDAFPLLDGAAVQRGCPAGCGAFIGCWCGAWAHSSISSDPRVLGPRLPATMARERHAAAQQSATEAARTLVADRVDPQGYLRWSIVCPGHSIADDIESLQKTLQALHLLKRPCVTGISPAALLEYAAMRRFDPATCAAAIAEFRASKVKPSSRLHPTQPGDVLTVEALMQATYYLHAVYVTKEQEHGAPAARHTLGKLCRCLISGIPAALVGTGTDAREAVDRFNCEVARHYPEFQLQTQGARVESNSRDGCNIVAFTNITTGTAAFHDGREELKLLTQAFSTTNPQLTAVHFTFIPDAAVAAQIVGATEYLHFFSTIGPGFLNEHVLLDYISVTLRHRFPGLILGVVAMPRVGMGGGRASAAVARGPGKLHLQSICALFRSYTDYESVALGLAQTRCWLFPAAFDRSQAADEPGPWGTGTCPWWLGLGALTQCPGSPALHILLSGYMSLEPQLIIQYPHVESLITWCRQHLPNLADDLDAVGMALYDRFRASALPGNTSVKRVRVLRSKVCNIHIHFADTSGLVAMAEWFLRFQHAFRFFPLEQVDPADTLAQLPISRDRTDPHATFYLKGSVMGEAWSHLGVLLSMLQRRAVCTGDRALANRADREAVPFDVSRRNFVPPVPTATLRACAADILAFAKAMQGYVAFIPEAYIISVHGVDTRVASSVTDPPIPGHEERHLMRKFDTKYTRTQLYAALLDLYLNATDHQLVLHCIGGPLLFAEAMPTGVQQSPEIAALLRQSPATDTTGQVRRGAGTPRGRPRGRGRGRGTT